MSAPASPLLIIASHGQLASAMLETARLILGSLEPAVAVCLTQNGTLEQLEKEIAEALADSGAAPRPAILLVDLFGGSCSNVAAKLLRKAIVDQAPLRVIAGFNLAMLIEFAFSRERYTLDELADRMIDAGKRACLDVNTKYLGVAGR